MKTKKGGILPINLCPMEKIRDEKGDVEFNYKRPTAEELRKIRYTYVFRIYDEERKRHVPCFDIHRSSELNSDLIKIHLYPLPEGMTYRDQYIRHSNRQLAMRTRFFKEVFEERAFVEGYQPSHKFAYIILSRSVHDQIMNCMNDHGLLPIRDLIFEIIAIAQDKYVEDIVFWEQPFMQKLVNTAAVESRKVIEILDKLDSGAWELDEPGSKPPSELKHINFVFDDGAIRLEHSWLAGEFIRHFKEYYDDLPYKNWRMELERYPEHFEENIRKQQFKFRLSLSFYNMLTQTGFFKITEQKKTPNNLMRCISKLLEFCLIPVAGPGELEEIKIKNVRNWISRKELEPAVTFVEIPPDKYKLLKYFEPWLVNMVVDTKRADAITTAGYVAKRFGLDHLFSDIVQIAQALNETNWLIGHQILGEDKAFESTFREFQIFRKLVNGIRNKKKITKIKYSLEGDDREYELTQRLPLYLTEESIREYSDSNRTEFDTDAVRTTLTKNADGSIKVDKEDHFNEPANRFMTRFVKAFYQYLLNEAPPGEHEYLPSNKYYAIIAHILQESGLFYSQSDSEEYIVYKVKQWHTLP
jgi:hypothetical protein